MTVLCLPSPSYGRNINHSVTVYSVMQKNNHCYKLIIYNDFLSQLDDLKHIFQSRNAGIGGRSIPRVQSLVTVMVAWDSIATCCPQSNNFEHINRRHDQTKYFIMSHHPEAPPLCRIWVQYNTWSNTTWYGLVPTELPPPNDISIRSAFWNWNITWAVALDVTNINFLIAHFATIYENIISLHVSLTFGTVCQTVLWMLAL